MGGEEKVPEVVHEGGGFRFEEAGEENLHVLAVYDLREEMTVRSREGGGRRQATLGRRHASRGVAAPSSAHAIAQLLPSRTGSATHRIFRVLKQRVDVLDQDVVLETEQLDDLLRDPRLHDAHLHAEHD